MLIARPVLWLVMVALGFGGLVLLPSGVTVGLDTMLLDALAEQRRAQVALSAAPRSPTVLVVADAPGLERLGYRWPFGPGVLARVVEQLTRAKVAAVGLDGRMARVDSSDAAGHQALVAAMKASGRVVLRDELASVGCVDGPVRGWHESFEEVAAGHGTTRLGPAQGRTLRQVGLAGPSYPLELIKVFQPSASVRVDDTSLIVGGAFGSSLMVSLSPGSMLLVPTRTLVAHEVISLADLLEKKVDDGRLTGRIALVGITDPEQADGLVESGALRPRLELDATVLDNLLTAHVVGAPDRSLTLVGMALVLGLLALVGGFAPFGVVLLAVPSALALVLVVGAWIFVQSGQRLEVAACLGGVVAAGLAATWARWLERAALSGRFVALFGGSQVIGGRLFDDAVEHLKRRELPQALDLLRQAAKADAAMVVPCAYQMVMIHLQTRELEEAEPLFASLPPDRLSIVEAYDLGLRLADVGYYDEARGMFAAVHQRDETYRDVKIQLEKAQEALTSRSDVLERLVIKELRKDYDKLSLIRRGGMALIYQGMSRVQSKLVAIKILMPHLNSDQNLVGRFFLEAETLKEFDHPNIIKVHEIQKSGALQYYVMEHIHPAISLHDLIDKEGKLPTDRSIRLVKQLCRGLEYSHRKGVIHRDIKPHNILVTGDDVIKLIDFGIARVEHHGTMTMTGVVMGTPRYMAPEQIRGERVDERCDIYAVGVTFFEMISGIRGQQNPMVERISGGTSIQQLILRQALPSPLVAILLRCLENDKAKRYASPMEMISDLEDFESRPAGWEDL